MCYTDLGICQSLSHREKSKLKGLMDSDTDQKAGTLVGNLSNYD